MMKDLDCYLGATHSNICKTDVMTETPEKFHNPEIPTIIPDTGTERPKTDTEMTYLKKRSIDKALCFPQ